MIDFTITPEYLTNVSRKVNIIKKLCAFKEAEEILIKQIQPTLISAAGIGRYCAEFDFSNVRNDVFMAIIELLKEHGFTDIRPCENGKKNIEICWG
jgi:small-conductance mechanosensitive channel